MNAPAFGATARKVDSGKFQSRMGCESDVADALGVPQVFADRAPDVKVSMFRRGVGGWSKMHPSSRLSAAAQAARLDVPGSVTENR